MNLYLRHKLIKVLRLFCSFSDEGEDKILLQIFMSKKIRLGTYLDIGAYHPIKVSNTFMLYLWGWKGTCIDSHSKWKFRLFRHRDKFIKGYVDANTSYKVKNKMWTSDVEIAYYERNNDLKIKYDIKSIDASQFKDYDLLDLDVDGIDFKILVRLMNSHQPKWIIAETKCFKGQDEIHDYLIKLGYELLAQTTRNGIYEKKD